MDYRILGPFDVCVDGESVGLGGEKPRALLAILLLHRNEVVSADRLIDDLWGRARRRARWGRCARMCPGLAGR
jgi:DNA-binding SARP family transcriptional activator